MARGAWDLKKLKRAFLDALFPIHCHGCGREGAWACRACLAALRISALNLCPGCGEPSPGGATHRRCRENCGLDGLVSPYHYADPFVRNLIKDYKYHGAAEVGDILAGMAEVGASSLATAFPRGAKVVAMPLHPSRERMRGFNQADRLARAAASVLSAEVARPLRRKRSTAEQARLASEDRHENIRDAFSCVPISGDFVLVDDVVTTGETMRAAAAEMKKAGARAVVGFALAHGRGDELASS